MGEVSQSPNIVFASGAVLQPDGTITRVVEANAPRQTPDPAPAEPAVAEDGSDETDSPVPAEAAAPDESGASDQAEAPAAEPSPAEAAAAMGQQPGESNRSFRRRLWEENQQYQARHAEILRSQTEQQQRIAYLEGQLAALGKPSVEPQGQPQGAPAGPGTGLRPRPQPGQYADYQQYEDDLRRFWQEQDAAEAAARQAEEADRRTRAQWMQRTEEGRLRHRDYDVRVQTLEFSPVAGRVVAPFFLHSAQGPDILYHFGTNRADLEQLNGMHEADAARYLVDLERRLAGPRREPAPPAPRTNGTAPPAPAPMQPVGTGPAQPVVGFRRGMSLREYEGMRDKQRGGRP